MVLLESLLGELSIIWIVIGLIAGWLASLIVGGGGGLIGYLIAGLIGSVVGGFLAQQTAPWL